MKLHPEKGFFIDREQTVLENTFNVIVHVLGLVFSLIAFGVLCYFSAKSDDFYKMLGSLLFCLGLIFMYTSSVLFHSFSGTRFKPILKKIDHISIYTTIAGSYSPFLLVNLRHSYGLQFFAFLWILAVIGIIFKLFFSHRFRVLSLLTYIAMGWAGVILIDPLLHDLAFWGLVWLFAGGFLYTFGALFYMWESPYFAHTIWHIFVVLGSVAHFIAILFYVVLY